MMIKLQVKTLAKLQFAVLVCLGDLKRTNETVHWYKDSEGYAYDNG